MKQYMNKIVGANKSCPSVKFPPITALYFCLDKNGAHSVAVSERQTEHGSLLDGSKGEWGKKCGNLTRVKSP